MIELKTGDLAYIDSFGGLVPCKVISVESARECTVKVTADRPGYSRGEVIDYMKIGRIVPRSIVHVRNGQYRIRAIEVVGVPDEMLVSA